jgi:son of sevenless-like protein
MMQRCRTLNNYSTLTSIISALGTAPIHRLGRTWGQVSGRTSAILEQMRRLMASTKNFGEYRETLHLANPPCIPFFGMTHHLLARHRPALEVSKYDLEPCDLHILL